MINKLKGIDRELFMTLFESYISSISDSNSDFWTITNQTDLVQESYDDDCILNNTVNCDNLEGIVSWMSVCAALAERLSDKGEVIFELNEQHWWGVRTSSIFPSVLLAIIKETAFAAVNQLKGQIR